jgi:citrate lyase subunit beta/citryl-CoA lyase
MRSYLFVPADSERKLAKALSAGADCLILDLEDSVSFGRKKIAREIAAAFLKSTREAAERPMLMVRVNALSTGMTDEDLAGAMPGVPDAILLPKSNSGADVQQLAAMLSVHEGENGIDQEQTAIHALVTETAGGVLNAGTYARKTDRLKALAWGGEDLAADVGAASNRNAEGIYTDVFRMARSLTLLGAAAAGVDAVDTVYTDFRNEAELAEECAAAARDGFSGKMAIHPAQVPIINRAFTPTDEAVNWAKRVVALFEDAGADAGVLSLDGAMIDRPHLRQAERILARLSPAARD